MDFTVPTMQFLQAVQVDLDRMTRLIEQTDFYPSYEFPVRTFPSNEQMESIIQLYNNVKHEFFRMSPQEPHPEFPNHFQAQLVTCLEGLVVKVNDAAILSMKAKFENDPDNNQHVPHAINYIMTNSTKAGISNLKSILNLTRHPQSIRRHTIHETVFCQDIEIMLSDRNYLQGAVSMLTPEPETNGGMSRNLV